MLFAFYITAEFSCKVEIFEQGGLEPIIKLLSSTDCDVQVLRQFFPCSFKLDTTVIIIANWEFTV